MSTVGQVKFSLEALVDFDFEFKTLSSLLQMALSVQSVRQLCLWWMVMSTEGAQ